MENEEAHKRKAKLRCHQPPPPSYTTYYPPQRLMPLNIQSASTSPHEVHMNTTPVPTLPHFHDTLWTRPSAPNACAARTQTNSDFPMRDSLQQQQPQQQLPPPHQYYTQLNDSPIPTAPFANAGPPGFQFYTTPAQLSPLPAHSYNWSRGRRL